MIDINSLVRLANSCVRLYAPSLGVWITVSKHAGLPSQVRRGKPKE
jgi:hypothetical protein